MSANGLILYICTIRLSPKQQQQQQWHQKKAKGKEEEEQKVLMCNVSEPLGVNTFLTMDRYIWIWRVAQSVCVCRTKRFVKFIRT